MLQFQDNLANSTAWGRSCDMNDRSRTAVKWTKQWQRDPSSLWLSTQRKRSYDNRLFIVNTINNSLANTEAQSSSTKKKATVEIQNFITCMLWQEMLFWGDKKKLLSCFSSQRLFLAPDQLHWITSEYRVVVHFPSWDFSTGPHYRNSGD